MEKWNRKYLLQIEDKNKQIHTFIDQSIDFTVNRNIHGTANDGMIIIRNLSERTRNLFLKDRMNTEDKRLLILSAGYETTGIHIILKGEIFYCHTTRSGTELLTTISVIDGLNLYQSGYVAKSYAKGTKKNILIKDLVNKAEQYRVTQGQIEDFAEEIPNALTVDSYWKQCVPDNHIMYVENQTLNILKKDKPIDGDILLINSTTGLLDVPVRFDNYIEVKMILESSVKLCQKVKLESEIDKSINGEYLIQGIKHNGTISEQGSGGECTTTLELQRN
jgi:hypothetical protein